MSPCPATATAWDLHYGRDDFASQDKLINTPVARTGPRTWHPTTSPRRANAERRGIISHPRDAAVERVHVPDNALDRIDDIILSVREPRDGAEGPERETANRG